MNCVIRKFAYFTKKKHTSIELNTISNFSSGQLVAIFPPSYSLIKFNYLTKQFLLLCYLIDLKTV